MRLCKNEELLVGHLAQPSKECSWYSNWRRVHLCTCIWAKGGHFELSQHSNWAVIEAVKQCSKWMCF